MLMRRIVLSASAKRRATSSLLCRPRPQQQVVCPLPLPQSEIPSRNVSSKTPKITDEGLAIHESDPSTTGDSLGLVWGSVIWPSGVSLAKYVWWRGPEFVRSKRRVLEMGCGTAIVGLTVAKMGAESVTLTDCESSLWPTIRSSINANNLHSSDVMIRCLDWRDPDTFLSPGDFDLVLAADVLYAGMDKLFARALASHVGYGVDGMIACPFRTDSPLIGFFEASIRLGLCFERLEDKRGSAAGATMAMPSDIAFHDSRFVSLDSVKQRETVAHEPIFSPSNADQVQIFRVRRCSGTPEDAKQIRRVGRI